MKMHITNKIIKQKINVKTWIEKPYIVWERRLIYSKM